MRHKNVFLAVVLTLLFAGSAWSADKYVFDAAHTYIGFSVRHLGISNVRGRFKDFSGTFLIDEKNMSKCVADVAIQVSSIDTNNEKRDAHLKSGDFFDAEKYPTMMFKSKKLKKAKNGYVVTGDLTIHGVTKEVKIPFTVEKVTVMGKTHIGVEGGLTINRLDYGVKWNKILDKGGLMVGNDVNIELTVDAVKE